MTRLAGEGSIPIRLGTRDGYRKTGYPENGRERPSEKLTQSRLSFTYVAHGSDVYCRQQADSLIDRAAGGPRSQNVETCPSQQWLSRSNCCCSIGVSVQFGMADPDQIKSALSRAPPWPGFVLSIRGLQSPVFVVIKRTFDPPESSPPP